MSLQKFPSLNQILGLPDYLWNWKKGKEEEKTNRLKQHNQNTKNKYKTIKALEKKLENTCGNLLK